MAYVPPNEVTAPRSLWTKICVFYNEGEGKIALGYGEWDGKKSIVIRWNGTDKPGDQQTLYYNQCRINMIR